MELTVPDTQHRGYTPLRLDDDETAEGQTEVYGVGVDSQSQQGDKSSVESDLLPHTQLAQEVSDIQQNCFDVDDGSGRLSGEGTEGAIALSIDAILVQYGGGFGKFQFALWCITGYCWIFHAMNVVSQVRYV